MQAHNPVDDAKEELKEDISNLKQEVMVGIVLQYTVIGQAPITVFTKYIPNHSLHFTFYVTADTDEAQTYLKPIQNYLPKWTVKLHSPTVL